MRRLLIAFLALTSLAFWAEHLSPPLVRFAFAQSGITCNATPLTRSQILTAFADTAPTNIAPQDLRNAICALLDGGNTYAGNNSHTGTETFSGSIVVPWVTKTAAYQFLATDSEAICANLTGSAFTITLDNAPIDGQIRIVKDCYDQANTHNLTVAAGAGATVEVPGGTTAATVVYTAAGANGIFKYLAPRAVWVQM